MKILLGLGIVLLAIATLIGLAVQRVRKLHHVKRHRPVHVQGATNRYPDLPLGNYGVPIRIGDARRPHRVEMIFPRLTADGDVEYLYSWHNLADIKRVRSGPKSSPSQTLVSSLAPIILQHLQIEADLADLDVKQTNLRQAIDLVSTSEFYASQISIYQQANVQLEALANKAEALRNLHIRLIRESLIGTHLAKLDTAVLIDGSPDFEQEYQLLKEEFLYLKESAIAYSELLHGAESQHDGYQSSSQ